MTAHEFVYHRCPSLLFSAQSITEPGAHCLASELQGSASLCLGPAGAVRAHCCCWLLRWKRVGWGCKLIHLSSPRSHIFFFLAWIKTFSFDLSSLVASSPTSLTPSPWNWAASSPDTAKGRQMERSLKSTRSRMPSTPSSPALMHSQQGYGFIPIIFFFWSLF